MAKQKIFISSVQAEFAKERQELYNYLLADPLLGRFFEPFLFENLPAIDQRTDAIYLREVESCNIYLALLGKDYGSEDNQGISPTEREFDKASELHKTRFVYLSQHAKSERAEKQNSFINKAQLVLVRKQFSSIEELKAAVYASLVNFLIETEIIRTAPFDASIHPKATLLDIDEAKVKDFVRAANFKRGFPFLETASVTDIFTHLNLMNERNITNAALLLFGKSPQRFFINSEVRCAHFHGKIVEKPIPSYKVFKGDVFELVDQAVDFVLSKLDYTVGTRAIETSIPGRYEIPKEIISEAIVNAIAHRDYTHNGSVQVMLFRDRLEVLNPGALPLGWNVEKLKKPHASVPFNPLLAEPMYLKGYIERMGTGTSDMVRISKENKLKEPDYEQSEDFKITLYRPLTYQEPALSISGASEQPIAYRSATAVLPKYYGSTSPEVLYLLKTLDGEMSRKQIQQALELKHEGNFRENYLEPSLIAGLIKMKYPHTPNHPKQRYLITEKGIHMLKEK